MWWWRLYWRGTEEGTRNVAAGSGSKVERVSNLSPDSLKEHFNALMDKFMFVYNICDNFDVL